MVSGCFIGDLFSGLIGVLPPFNSSSSESTGRALAICAGFLGERGFGASSVSVIDLVDLVRAVPAFFTGLALMVVLADLATGLVPFLLLAADMFSLSLLATSWNVTFFLPAVTFGNSLSVVVDALLAALVRVVRSCLPDVCSSGKTVFLDRPLVFGGTV